MRHRWIFLLFVGVVVLFGLAPAAQAADVTVDCTGGPADFATVTDALNALDLQGPHTIHVVGNCTERIRIVDRDRITLDGSPDGSTFISPQSGVGRVIYIANSRGIVLRQIGATDGFNGVVIDRASEVALEGCTFSGNANHGVVIDNKSLVTAPGSIFTANGTNGVVVRGQSTYRVVGALHDSNGNFGLLVNEGSTAIVGDFSADGESHFNANGQRGIACANGCTLFLDSAAGVGFNGFAGLTVSNGSRAFIDGSGGFNEFTGNGNGVLVFRGAAATFSGPNSIHDNTGVGLEADENSSVILADITVQNNAQGGVSALHTSTVGFTTVGAGGNALTGNGGSNVSCDSTALIFGDLTGVSGISCTRIERSVGPPRPGRVRE